MVAIKKDEVDPPEITGFPELIINHLIKHKIIGYSPKKK